MRLHSVFLPLALMICSVSGRAQLTWEFVNELSDGNVIEVNAVKTDIPRSCVYIVGTFSSDLSSSFTFGLNGTPDFSTNYGGTDGFVAKYDDSGNFLWAFMIGGAGTDEVVDVEVDLPLLYIEALSEKIYLLLLGVSVSWQKEVKEP